MKKKQVVYINEYIKGQIHFKSSLAKNYTIPKLYIPKTDGKPTVEKGKYWYVYYYYRNPLTGKYDQGRPIIEKQGINYLKTVTERKTFGKELIAVLTNLLENGYSPFENLDFQTTGQHAYTITEAFDYAIEQKTNEVKKSTADDYAHRLVNFKRWLTANNIQSLHINDLNRNHIAGFLNYVAKSSSNRNVNNYKTALSSLYGKLVADGIVASNFFSDMEKRKTTPLRHKAYTPTDLATLKKFLLRHDPYLYHFMAVMGYTFLRPREIVRLTVGDVDLIERRINVSTKEVKNESIIIIEKILSVFQNFGLKGLPKGYHLFTPEDKPGAWHLKNERDKVTYFSKRFKKLKDKHGLEQQYTIYSIRHTFAVNLYNTFIRNGLNQRETILKMLPITRHKSEKSLRNYLRSVNAFVSDDFSDKFSIDF